jgi:hypothetical protein
VPEAENSGDRSKSEDRLNGGELNGVKESETGADSGMLAEFARLLDAENNGDETKSEDWLNDAELNNGNESER